MNVEIDTEIVEEIVEELKEEVNEDEAKDEDIQPNYLNHTYSSLLPNYFCSEHERIKSSFRTGNFCYIKALPSTLKAGEINLSRKEQNADNIKKQPEPPFKPSSKNGSSFNTYTYAGMDYDKQNNLNKIVIDEEKIRIDSHSRKPFKISSRIRSKTEDVVFDPEYRFPDFGPGKDAKKLESMTRTDVHISDKFRCGPFHLNQRRLASVASGLKVQEWSRKIFDQLLTDWPAYKFKVKFTESNEFIIQFESLSTSNSIPFPPPNDALQKYMQRMATHGIASEFGLKKRGDRWNKVEYEVTNVDLEDVLQKRSLQDQWINEQNIVMDPIEEEHEDSINDTNNNESQIVDEDLMYENSISARKYRLKKLGTSMRTISYELSSVSNFSSFNHQLSKKSLFSEANKSLSKSYSNEIEKTNSSDTITIFAPKLKRNSMNGLSAQILNSVHKFGQLNPAKPITTFIETTKKTTIPPTTNNNNNNIQNNDINAINRNFRTQNSTNKLVSTTDGDGYYIDSLPSSTAGSQSKEREENVGSSNLNIHSLRLDRLKHQFTAGTITTTTEENENESAFLNDDVDDNNNDDNDKDINYKTEQNKEENKEEVFSGSTTTPKVLVFSFYAPWLKVSQLHINHLIGKKNRELAKIAGEKYNKRKEINFKEEEKIVEHTINKTENEYKEMLNEQFNNNKNLMNNKKKSLTRSNSSINMESLKLSNETDKKSESKASNNNDIHVINETINNIIMNSKEAKVKAVKFIDDRQRNELYGAILHINQRERTDYFSNIHSINQRRRSTKVISNLQQSLDENNTSINNNSKRNNNENSGINFVLFENLNNKPPGSPKFLTNSNVEDNNDNERINFNNLSSSMKLNYNNNNNNNNNNSNNNNISINKNRRSSTHSYLLPTSSLASSPTHKMPKTSVNDTLLVSRSSMLRKSSTLLGPYATHLITNKSNSNSKSYH